MRRPILAVLCDLDGVVTKTARVHAEAWKQVFDNFFYHYEEKAHILYSFNIVNDYIQFIDGEQQIEGVKEFLLSKNISITEDIIYDLAQKKDKIFLQLLEKQGVEINDDNFNKLNEWKQQGMKLGLVSSSRNCQPILKKSKLSSFFQVCIDELAEQEQLKGIYRNTFLYAATKLNVPPESIMVIEDATVGIEVAKQGNFGLVVGLIHPNNYQKMQKSRADVLVTTLEELVWNGKQIRFPRYYQHLPNACNQINEMEVLFSNHQLVVFLDYDGTLTPIVGHPENAILNDSMREVLSQLSKLVKITIISGRDRNNIQSLVNLPNVFYVGNHGLDMEGLDEKEIVQKNIESSISTLRQVWQELALKLASVSGIQIEPKKFTLAVHYRNVATEKQSEILAITQQIVERYSNLTIVYGKKVLDVCPKTGWNKGEALKWLISKFDLVKDKIVPIYIGDDLTDENAFRALTDDGIGILVGNHGSKTYADFVVKDPVEVQEFLKKIIQKLKGRE